MLPDAHGSWILWLPTAGDGFHPLTPSSLPTASCRCSPWRHASLTTPPRLSAATPATSALTAPGVKPIAPGSWTAVLSASCAASSWQRRIGRVGLPLPSETVSMQQALQTRRPVPQSQRVLRALGVRAGSKVGSADDKRRAA